MSPGSIALARVQQADGRLKTRPVVILTTMPPFSDYVVCAVSSKLQHECPGFDELVAAEDHDYQGSGLKVPSLIRLRVLATIPRPVVLGDLGRISSARLRRLRSRLARKFEAESGPTPPDVRV